MNFLSQLAASGPGFGVLFGLIFGLGALVQWILWMFRLGRFRDSTRGQNYRGIMAELTQKLIYEFRHLLALVIIVLFAAALFLAIWPGVVQGNAGLIGDGLKNVTGTLGGLIGSIIGYSFGESAAGRNGIPSGSTPQPAEQSPTDVPGQPPIVAPAKPVN